MNGPSYKSTDITLLKRISKILIRHLNLIQFFFSCISIRMFCSIILISSLSTKGVSMSKTKTIAETTNTIEHTGSTSAKVQLNSDEKKISTSISKKSDLIKVLEKLSSAPKYKAFIEKIQMVARASNHAMIVVGEAGVAKSTIVPLILNDEGLTHEKDYIFVRGYSTALSFFQKLYDNNGKIIVVDDCDAILTNRTSLDILKAALDDKFQRTISYETRRQNTDLPKTFNFTGRIIFITNFKPKENDIHFAAVKDRCLVQTLYLSTKEKLEYIEKIIVPSDYKNTTLDERKNVFTLLADMVTTGGTTFSFRTYLKALDHHRFNPETVEIHLEELVQSKSELTLLITLRKERPQDPEYWRTRFMEVTGKSRRTYFYNLAKVKQILPLPKENLT